MSGVVAAVCGQRVDDVSGAQRLLAEGTQRRLPLQVDVASDDGAEGSDGRQQMAALLRFKAAVREERGRAEETQRRISDVEALGGCVMKKELSSNDTATLTRYPAQGKSTIATLTTLARIDLEEGTDHIFDALKTLLPLICSALTQGVHHQCAALQAESSTADADQSHSVEVYSGTRHEWPCGC